MTQYAWHFNIILSSLQAYFVTSTHRSHVHDTRFAFTFDKRNRRPVAASKIMACIETNFPGNVDKKRVLTKEIFPVATQRNLLRLNWCAGTRMCRCCVTKPLTSPGRGPLLPSRLRLPRAWPQQESFLD